MIGSSASGTVAADAEFSWRAGVVPPFRVAARDRAALAASVAGNLGPVQLRLRGDALRDQSADGDVVIGPGDLRLGTVVAGPVGHGAWVGLGWEVKLPDAADEGELGTDETDVLFGGSAGWTGSAAWADLALGLGVLGNPLRFANQDDVPMLRARGGWRAARWSADGALRWDLATSRNPARAEVGAHAGLGRRIEVRAGGLLGLSPAAADWGVDLGLVVRFGIPGPPPLSEGPGGG